MDNKNNESRSMKNTTIFRENDNHEDEILSFKEKVPINENNNISEIKIKKEKIDEISEIEPNYDINQFNINENNIESSRQIICEDNKNNIINEEKKDKDKVNDKKDNNNGNPTMSEKDKESNFKLLNVYDDIKERTSLLNNNNGKNDNNSMSENSQEIKNKKIKNSSNDEIEKSETQILDEFNYLRDELINYTDDFFSIEENYVLPDKNTMSKYPVILLNSEKEEELFSKINNYYDKDTLEQKLNFIIEKEYIKDRLIGIKDYWKKKYNNSSKFENFLEFFGESPFFGCSKNNKISEISFYNFENKKRKNSTIGDIEHFSNLLYKYKKYQNNEIKKEKEIENKQNKSNKDYITSTLKDLGYHNITNSDNVYFYRKVINDGNTFYRAFMFGLIEMYILNNIKYLNYFITFMRLIINNYKNIIFEDRNYINCLLILEEILKYLNNNFTNKALELFYDSFSLNTAYFDKALIIFLKFILYYSKKKPLSNFNYELIEFEIYDLILLPYIFDISLEISFDINSGKNEFLVFDTNIVRKDTLPLRLCLYKNNTFIYYDMDMYILFVKNNIMKTYDKIPKINKIIYKFEKKELCQKCKKETFHIALIEKSIRICENCLKIHVDKIIQNRIKSLPGNYISQDVISKNIFFKKENFYLEDYEYLYLYNENILDSIQRKLVNYITEEKIWFCSKCQKFLKNTKKLKCGCYYCSNCLYDIIFKMTNEYMILNKYEKKHIGKVRCQCGVNMDILSVIEDEEEKEKNNKYKDKYKSMVERFNEYIKTLCMNCEIKIFDNNNPDKINVLNNKNEQITESHVLCKKCVNSLKIKEKNKIKILCKICSENHDVTIE